MKIFNYFFQLGYLKNVRAITIKPGNNGTRVSFINNINKKHNTYPLTEPKI